MYPVTLDFDPFFGFNVPVMQLQSLGGNGISFPNHR